MIEVEIRGRLDKAGFDRLKQFMEKSGKHIQSHEREMYLLLDYPGFDIDPNVRSTDIRLRRTDDFCEIMLKRNVGAHNAAREEISLPLGVSELAEAKKMLSALGHKQAIGMQRWKDIYIYQGVEWSLVRTPKDYFYYEAELVVENGVNPDAAHKQLEAAVKALELPLLDPDGTREFFYFLDKEVNEIVDL